MRSKMMMVGTLALALGIGLPAFAQEAATEKTPQAEAGTEPVVEQGPEAESVAAPAAAETPQAQSGRFGVVPEGKGRIVFFRPSKFTGAAIGFKVREGETELGKLRNGRYFVADVEPGTHEYTVHSEAKDVLTMEVEAGETYYVQGTITMGFMAGRPNLSPSDEATFEGMADKLKAAE